MRMDEPLLRRRRVLVLAVGGLTACDRLQALAGTDGTLSEEDKALKHKFRGLRGGQLRVDSLFEVNGLNIFDHNGKLFFARAQFVPPTGDYIGSYGADFGVPKFLRVEWRSAANDWRMDGPNGAAQGGTLLGNYTVPVASRIPDALLDDLRANGGGFRLKIRTHQDGPLIGWDIQRALSSAPDGSAFHHAGGDFQEARPFIKFADKPRAFIKPGTNPVLGEGMLKGWYVHPKTKQRIETDF
jgi:hypothetical protein